VGVNFVPARQLIGVAEGVPEIEQHALARVPLVTLHHRGFAGAAGIQHLFDAPHDGGAGRGGLQEPEQGLVQDAAVFDHLGHAVGEDRVGQGGETAGVGQHQPGLPESARQVFARLEIYRHLAAHRGVHLGQQGGGQLDEIHPPQNGGGGKARQVPHDPAAQGGHGVGPGEAEGQELVVKVLQHGHRLGALPWGHLDHLHPVTGGLQRARKSGGIQGRDVGVCNDSHPGGARNRLAEIVPRACYEAG
jgi:hypothetical protein